MSSYLKTQTLAHKTAIAFNDRQKALDFEAYLKHPILSLKQFHYTDKNLASLGLFSKFFY